MSKSDWDLSVFPDGSSWTPDRLFLFFFPSEEWPFLTGPYDRTGSPWTPKLHKIQRRNAFFFYKEAAPSLSLWQKVEGKKMKQVLERMEVRAAHLWLSAKNRSLSITTESGLESVRKWGQRDFWAPITVSQSECSDKKNKSVSAR